MDYNKEINKIKNKRNRVLYLRYGIGFLFLGVCIFLVILMAKSKFGYKDEQEIIRTVVGDFKYEPIKKNMQLIITIQLIKKLIKPNQISLMEW